MLRNGQPYVPSSCPEKHGEDIDLLTARMEFLVDTSYSYIRRLIRIEAYAVFHNNANSALASGGDAVNCVETGSLIGYAGSEAFKQACAINACPILQDKLREALLGRIARCRGIIDKGKCWALSEPGFAKAVEECFK